MRTGIFNTDLKNLGRQSDSTRLNRIMELAVTTIGFSLIAGNIAYLIVHYPI